MFTLMLISPLQLTDRGGQSRSSAAFCDQCRIPFHPRPCRYPIPPVEDAPRRRTQSLLYEALLPIIVIALTRKITLIRLLAPIAYHTSDADMLFHSSPGSAVIDRGSVYCQPITDRCRLGARHVTWSTLEKEFQLCGRASSTATATADTQEGDERELLAQIPIVSDKLSMTSAGFEAKHMPSRDICTREALCHSLLDK